MWTRAGPARSRTVSSSGTVRRPATASAGRDVTDRAQAAPARKRLRRKSGEEIVGIRMVLLAPAGSLDAEVNTGSAERLLRHGASSSGLGRKPTLGRLRLTGGRLVSV